MSDHEQRETHLVVAALLSVALGAGFFVGAVMMLWSEDTRCFQHAHPTKSLSSSIHERAGIGLSTPE